MGLAAFAVPLASSGAATAAEAAPAPAATALPKPKPKKKKAKPKAGGAAKNGPPLASTDEIPVNGGMLFEAEEYIVTQPKKGQFVGFDSLCTHEGCPVDGFETPGKMACPCHGAEFDLATGKPTAGPARKPLPKKPIIVEGGKIYKGKA